MDSTSSIERGDAVEDGREAEEACGISLETGEADTTYDETAVDEGVYEEEEAVGDDGIYEEANSEDKTSEQHKGEIHLENG